MAAPALVPVPEDYAARASVTAERYANLYKQSIEDPESFWKLQLTRLDWMKTPTQIAERNGVSAQKVVRIISALELRDHPTQSWKYLNKADASNRTVVCYRYAPEAVTRIEAALGIAAEAA